jgi:transketolase C-terminal domain/subunit
MVAELIAESSKQIQLKRIGVNDEFGQSGTASELLDFYELLANKLVVNIERKLG